jgi:hypothetical protein
MIRRIALCALAILASPAAALAQPTPVSGVTVEAAKTQKASAKASAADQVVCKRVVPVGSRMPGKKICLTQGQWAAQTATAKEELDTLTRKGLAANQVH